MNPERIHHAWHSILNASIDGTYVTAKTVEAVCEDLQRSTACTLEQIGTSKQGRPVQALAIGDGTTVITIKGNAHADEPTGIITCIQLVRLLKDHPDWRPLLDRFRFCLVPTANPDGLARNQGWLSSSFSLEQYFRHVYRDLPQNDVEFGYPSDAAEIEGVRPENVACARFFDACAPIASHISLHSMVFTGGAWFLLSGSEDPGFVEPVITFLTSACRDISLPLHDEDRGGQRGFARIAPGFHTIPTVEGMQTFFKQSGNTALTSQFRLNSMQYNMRFNDARYTAVSELPYAYDSNLADMTATDLPRPDLERQRAEIQVEVLDELAKIIEETGDYASTEEGQFRLGYYREYLSYRRAGHASLTRDLDRFSHLKATTRDLHEVRLLLLRHRVYNVAAALQILQGNTSSDAQALRQSYEKLYQVRFDGMINTFQFTLLPVEAQVRLQLASILAGLLIASLDG